MLVISLAINVIVGINLSPMWGIIVCSIWDITCYWLA